MRRKLIPLLMKVNSQPDLRNQEVIDYKVWINQTLGNWSDTGNWRGGTKPTGGDNVLFGPYQGTCIVNEDTNTFNSFRVRNDFTSDITCNRVVSLSGYFTYYGDGTLSLNSSTINVTSGDVRFDGDGRVFWDRSVWNLSGGFNQVSLDTPVDNFSTINMRGSGKTVASNDELYRLNILGATIVDDDVILKGPLNVSGDLTINSGVSVINKGVKAKVSVYSSGRTLGQGSLVLEEEASLIRNQGYIGNDYLVIKNNTMGEILPPSTYSAKEIIIKNDTTAHNNFVFGRGVYNLDSHVSFQSTGGGILEINNRSKAAEVYFNRNLTVTSGTFSEVVWETGKGSIIFGKSTSMNKAFTRSLSERGGVNIADSVRGLALSHKSKINDRSVIWVLSTGDMNFANSGVAVRAITEAGHSVGYFLITSNVPATGYGNICISRRPIFLSERMYISDIADADASRPIVRIYHGTEPTITGLDFYSDVGGSNYSLQYPASPVGESGGIARDSRAFSMDYNSLDIYIVTAKTNPPQLFFLASGNYIGTQSLSYSGTLQIESGVVGMDIARNSKEIIVKTPSKIYYYQVTGNSTICQTLTGTVPLEILDYVPGYLENGIAWGSGQYINDTIYTMETFNPDTHDHDIRSPFWLYRKRSEIDTKGLLLDSVTIGGSGHEKVLVTDLRTNDLSVMSGTFNLSGHNITTLEDFYVGPYGNFNRRGFKSGATITVSGDFLAVGSSSNMLNMHPDSGDGGWVLHVGGEGRTYYAEVRASNAASGSTIYSYVGADYGANTNWNFAGSGGAPLSGYSVDLYISGGSSGIGINHFIPLFLVGQSGNLSGNLFLYTTGGTPGSAYNYIDLYITGGIRGNLTGSIPLYLANSGVDGSIPLFISGYGISSGFVPLSSVLYLTLANSGIGSGMDIITIGGGSLTGGCPLYIGGTSGISGGVPLIITSFSSVTSGPNGLRLYSHGKHANA